MASEGPARNRPRERFPFAICRTAWPDPQPQLLRNSAWFRILSAVMLARRRKSRRNCSPTEYRCCRARIIPACSRSASANLVWSRWKSETLKV